MTKLSKNAKVPQCDKNTVSDSNYLTELKNYAKELLKSKSKCKKFFIDAGIHNRDGSLNENYR